MFSLGACTLLTSLSGLSGGSLDGGSDQLVASDSVTGAKDGDMDATTDEGATSPDGGDAHADALAPLDGNADVTTCGCITPTLLATQRQGPTDIGVDPSGAVFWLDGIPGTVERHDPGSDGGTLVSLGASGTASTMAVGGGFLEWASTSSGAWKQAITAGAPSELIKANAISLAISNDPTNTSPLCLLDSTGKYRLDCCKVTATVDGGGCTNLAFGLDFTGFLPPRFLVAEGSREVFYGSFAYDGGADAGILACGGSCSAGKPTPLAATLSLPGGIAADSNYAYWTETGALNKVNLSGPPASVKLATVAGSPGPVAVSTDGVVVWIDGNNLMKISTYGGAPVTLVKAQASPSSVAINGTDVYWTTTADGSVWTIPRCSCAP